MQEIMYIALATILFVLVVSRQNPIQHKIMMFVKPNSWGMISLPSLTHSFRNTGKYLGVPINESSSGLGATDTKVKEPEGQCSCPHRTDSLVEGLTRKSIQFACQPTQCHKC